MALNGTLQSIILNYITVTKIYDTFSEMIADTTITENQKVETLGYYTKNDGGGALYYVGDTIISPVVISNNDLYYNMIIEKNEIPFNCLGGKGDDNTFNNSPILQNALSIITNKNLKLLFTNKEYYFADSISVDDIRLCEITSNYISRLYFTGNGWFFSTPITNNITISNLQIYGNNANNGLFFGDTNCYRTFLRNVEMRQFVKSIYIGRGAYFYIINCNLYANTNNDCVLQIGNSTSRLNNELIYIESSIFAGAEALTSTGDFIRIYQVSTLRVINTDFANTQGKWLYFDNTPEGDIFDISFTNCQFTRAKHGIDFYLTKNKFIENMYFDNCFFSLYGNWSDGEDKIINVRRTNGGIENSYFKNNTITQIYTNYSPDYFFYDSSNTSKIFINILRKPNIANKFLIAGTQGLFENLSYTLGTNISAVNLTVQKNKLTNTIQVLGLLKNTEGNITAYSSLLTCEYLKPINVNQNFLAIADDGTCFPLYIENGILKNRKAIPQNTNARLIINFETLA